MNENIDNDRQGKSKNYQITIKDKLTNFFLDQKSSSRKKIERKINSSILNRSISHKKSAQKHRSPKFLPNDAIRRRSNFDAMHDKINIDEILDRNIEIPKQVTKESLRTGNSLGKSQKSQKDYYKYWKCKALQYQQMNFNLNRLNSALLQENQILRHQAQKLEKRISKLVNAHQNEPAIINQDLKPDMGKVQTYYKHKLEQMGRKIAEKDLLIVRQERKIRELSRQIEQNFKLRNLLDNMEDKLSERESQRDKNSSFDEKSDKQLNERPVREFKMNNFQRVHSGDNLHKNYNPERRSYRTRDA